jgi:hypothetical protein
MFASHRIAEAPMKLTDFIALLPTVNNGYALTAFLAAFAVWLYLGSRRAR